MVFEIFTGVNFFEVFGLTILLHSMCSDYINTVSSRAISRSSLTTMQRNGLCQMDS